MQPETTATHPIIRTYKGPDKRAAENAYRADARQAAVVGWTPVAHRWTESWDGHELAVVFELRATEVLKAPAIAVGPGAAPDALDPAPDPDPDDASAPVTVDHDDRPDVADGSDDDADSTPTGERGIADGALVAAAGLPAAAAAWGTASPPGQDAGPGVGPVTTGIGADAGADGAGGGDADGPADDSAPVIHPPAPEATTAARAHARAILQTLDLHCAGEPLRLIRTGYPQVPDAPILERRRWVTEHADWARTALLLEPRGHRDMYGAVLLPPHRPDADIAVLFLHNAGYSTMCGHGIIALTAGLIEERLYPATEPRTVIRFETPAGLVTATAEVAIGAHGGPEVRVVRFQNVPAYRHAANLLLALPELTLQGDAIMRGGLRVDVAYGGAYYGIVDVAELGLRVVPEQAGALARAGATITEALRRDHTPTHPVEADLGFVYGTIIVDTEPSTSPDGRALGATMRTVTVFADAEVDRSPCGTGTSALLAHLYAQGRLAIGQTVVNAGITGETFEARVEGETAVGGHPAVMTSVAGTGFVTGYGTFLVDDRDPLGDGFLLR